MPGTEPSASQACLLSSGFCILYLCTADCWSMRQRRFLHFSCSIFYWFAHSMVATTMRSIWLHVLSRPALRIVGPNASGSGRAITLQQKHTAQIMPVTLSGGPQHKSGGGGGSGEPATKCLPEAEPATKQQKQFVIPFHFGLERRWAQGLPESHGSSSLGFVRDSNVL